MNESLEQRTCVVGNIVWWVSRIISALVILTMGGFTVAYFIGGTEHVSRELTASDHVGLAAFVVSLVGLLVAWKWDAFGAAITLIAVLVGVAVNMNVLMFPLVLIPICACLFLLNAWIRRTSTSSRI